MKVSCSVAEIELVTDNGRAVPSVEASCSRCGHATESYGTSDQSVKRCLVLMCEQCPKQEKNFYVS